MRTEDDLVNIPDSLEAFLPALKQAGFFVRTAVMQGAPHYDRRSHRRANSFSDRFALRFGCFLAELL